VIKGSERAPAEPLLLMRTLNATCEEVFRAWTKPEAMARWFAPSDDYALVVPELDLKVGGRYQIDMHHSNGAIYRVTGDYREIDAPRRLAFSWRWLHKDMDETLVIIELRPVGTMTELVLTHGGLWGDAANTHEEGWRGCFDRLERFFGDPRQA
jgi:uncharacterized protein YndB with AHSA1/START domain